MFKPRRTDRRASKTVEPVSQTGCYQSASQLDRLQESRYKFWRPLGLIGRTFRVAKRAGELALLRKIGFSLSLSVTCQKLSSSACAWLSTCIHRETVHICGRCNCFKSHSAKYRAFNLCLRVIGFLFMTLIHVIRYAGARTMGVRHEVREVDKGIVTREDQSNLNETMFFILVPDVKCNNMNFRRVVSGLCLKLKRN
eukprot:scaffold66016_cov34-Prasinocladus_malaysianus.AAC.3